MTSTAFMADDIAGEILSWLPPKSVVRFKSVCKRWRELLSSSFFVAVHVRRNAHNMVASGFIFKHNSHPIKVVYDASCPRAFPHGRPLHKFKGVRFLHASNGLMLGWGFDKFDFRWHLLVYNPTTGQHKFLPNTEGDGEGDTEGNHYFALAFDPSQSTNYRVILAPRSSSAIKVYHSENNSWETFSLQTSPWTFSHWRWSSCYCNGAMYWMNHDVESLFRLDVEQRSVTDTMIRLPMEDYYRIVKLFESRGRFLLLRCKNGIGVIDIWEMRTSTADGCSRWLLLHKARVVDVFTDMHDQLGSNSLEIFRQIWIMLNDSLFAEFEDGDKLVMSLDHKVVAYNFRSKALEVVLDTTLEYSRVSTLLCPYVLCPYIRTLVSL